MLDFIFTKSVFKPFFNWVYKKSKSILKTGTLNDATIDKGKLDNSTFEDPFKVPGTIPQPKRLEELAKTYTEPQAIGTIVPSGEKCPESGIWECVFSPAQKRNPLMFHLSDVVRIPASRETTMPPYRGQEVQWKLVRTAREGLTKRYTAR
jgi:hypothetical protein